MNYYILCLIFLFLFVHIIIYKHRIVEKFSDINDNNIPKIIHQTAPSDKNKWDPLWFECQKTWKKHFPSPEYEYILWTDEDLENLIKTDFPSYLQIYKGYKKNIQRIDMARYFILYKYGGIYADMDYMTYQNFSHLLPNKISIVESPYKNNEHIQNSLMISPKHQDFWLNVIEKSKTRLNEENVLKSTGPALISDVYFENTNLVNVLPHNLWNSYKNEENVKYITRHLGTCTWCSGVPSPIKNHFKKSISKYVPNFVLNIFNISH